MSTENTTGTKAKIAIVTGGSRGIGRNTVLSLAKRSVNSIFTYNSNGEEAEKVTAAATQGGVLLLKFRAWCLEIADLLAQACPDAHTLFLGRNLEGWIRSMGRLLKVTDPEREAIYQRQGVDTPMFGFPRDRFISLLRRSSFRPEIWLEDVTLGWVSLMAQYYERYEKGVIQHALTYDDLIREPYKAVQAVATACQLPGDDFTAALAVFENDSQAGTHLSGRMLREQKAGELSEAEVTRAEAVARRHGIEPDLTNLLGTLFSA